MKTHRFRHDDEDRRKWQNPEAILRNIGLKSSYTFIDVGCGEGFFAIPAARLVGKKGKVHALDIDEEAVSKLKENAAREGLGNLNSLVGDAEKTVLCESCADIVFFGIDLHDFRNPAKVLMNAKKMLKPKGRLVDLDWKKEPMEKGPPLEIRFSEDQAISLIKKAGFKIETVKESGPYHYLIIAENRL